VQTETEEIEITEQTLLNEVRDLSARLTRIETALQRRAEQP
jgi:hypothetical protein